MRCHLCALKAITQTVEDAPVYVCKEHFLSYFEKKVELTIERFSLLKKDQRIAVACSGGKDSVAILVILKELGYDVIAVLIDEGIAGYRDKTKGELQALCEQKDIPLRVFSYKEHMGASLDTIMEKNSLRACRVCGVFRRALLHKGSKDFDALVTGHNLDDEAQAILMNLLKGQVDLLARQGPMSKGVGVFTPRVKPFYLCAEKEIRIYTLLRKFPIGYHECPHARTAFREEFSHALNELEESEPLSKWRFVHHFLTQGFPDAPHTISACIHCKEPCAEKICKVCELKEEMQI